jgi:two-component system sensor histidine kinase BarA
MNPRRPDSLRSRLTGLVALCAGLAAMLGMVAVAGTGWWLQQERAREDTEALLQTLAFTLEAPLAFEDAKGVADALAVLKLRPSVDGAWVLDEQGRLVGRHGTAGRPPAETGGGLVEGRLVLRKAVVLDGADVGTLVLSQDLTPLWTGLLTTLAAVGAASLLGFAATLTLARRLAGTLSRPMSELAEAARAMAADPASAASLQPHGGGSEVADAIDAFNRMRAEVAARDAALLAVNRDLERRVAERTAALRREKERAEAASIAKTRFLANMSHELRTPLNAVIGAAQLLQAQEERPAGAAGGQAASQLHLVEVIRQSGLNLLGLIENVLDLSRIETGTLELSPEDFNLLDCVEAALATAAVPARVKGLAMACIVDPRVPLWRHGDPLRLRQVLLNLLGNAVKFTLQGEVVLRVAPGASADALRITVSDTGIGISEASLAHVFEPFRQGDDDANRRFGGSGLGLAIARQIVEAMGGRIAADSRVGEGSRFEMELALPVLRAAAEDTVRLDLDVAYHEPHDASAQALETQLRRLGCRVRRCEGEADLRAWIGTLAASGGEAASAWLMVALDGPEAASMIDIAVARLDPRHVIGMSSGDSLRTEAMRQRLTMPRGIIKPVLRSSLVSRLGSVARDVSAPVASRSQAAQGERHVLVVEDDRVNQEIVCAMLRNAGYRTTTADDGAQALALMNCNDYDLVLMDWQMPDMDGLEVTRRLRSGAAGPRGRVVPIVALTANAFVEDRNACLASGMNDFLTKPVLAASLEATVGRWTQHAARAPRAAPAATIDACSSSNSCAPKAAPAVAG